MGKAYATTTVKRRPKDGKPGDSGDDGLNAVVASLSRTSVVIDCDSAGKPLATRNLSITASMHREGEGNVDDATIQKINSTTVSSGDVVDLGNGVTVRRASASSQIIVQYSKSTAVTSSTTFSVTIHADSLNTTIVLDVAVIANKQGAQGIPGIQGQMLRRRGKYTQSSLSTTAETIYNNEHWMDWIIYDDGNKTHKFRLADHVQRWTKDGYYTQDDPTTLVSGSFLPGSTAWTMFDEFQDAAFNFLIANGLDASQASICEAFIGTSGATLNDDGSISVSNTANGWAITGGQIRHTKTGLTLTQDGHLNDPNGLHLTVGGLAGTHQNLWYNAYFDQLMTEAIVSAGSFYAVIATIETNSYAYGNGALSIGGASSDAATLITNFMGSTEKGRGIRLAAGTYTFSAIARRLSLVSNCSVYLRVYSSSTKYMTSPTKLCEMVINSTSYDKYKKSFTLSSAAYVAFRVELIYSSSVSATVYVDAVKLEQGSDATAMCDTSFDDKFEESFDGKFGEELPAALLPTGIDIARRKITLTADMLLCQNNLGERTAWLDKSGNFTVTGVVNNLITVIDWANNINRDKIILAKYDSNNFEGYYQSGDDLSTTTLRCYIDVLRCGDFIHIKSLPDEVRGEHCDGFVRLPYFITDKYDLQDRGHTRDGLEDNDTPHLMMPDELRRLVGRKFTFRISDMDTNWFQVQLLGGFHFSVYDSGNIALQNVGNGQSMYLLPEKSQGVYPEATSFRMSIPSTLHFEFRQCEFWHLDTTQNAYIGGDYGYAWTCSMNLPQSFSGNEYIDEEWT